MAGILPWQNYFFFFGAAFLAALFLAVLPAFGQGGGRVVRAPRTRSVAPAPTRLKVSSATLGWDKGFGSRHVRGDYKILERFRVLTVSLAPSS